MSTERNLKDEDLQTHLNSWGDVNAVIDKLGEADLLRAIDLERAGKFRLPILVRLHQRFCKMRATREREALLVRPAGSPKRVKK